MPAGPTNYGQMPTGLFLETLQEVFMTEADTVVDYIPRAFNVSNTTRISNTYQGFAGLGPVPSWNGESNITLQNIQSRYEQTITQVFYRTGIAFTWKYQKYLQYRQLMRDQVSSLATTSKNTMQIQAFAYLNDGFTTVWNATDNVNFFSATHNLANGTTYSNLQTGALNCANLQSAITLLEMTPDDMGIVMGLKARRLWVHPDNYFNALEVLNRGVALRSDTANNTKNAFGDWDIEIVKCPHIDDTDSWYLQADKVKTVCEISNGLEQDQYDWKPAKSTIHEAMFAFAVGSKDWRGWVGSTGA